MKLYIAEKPSLGRAIAAALPKPHSKDTGFIKVGNGDVVTWCIGHILEQAEPDDYDPKYKQWRLEHLPITPDNWQLKPKSKTRSQLTVIRKLVKSATTLVNAGDPDREGQLLVDEVINYLKVPKAKVEQCQRLLISDLNLPAVKRALNSLKLNREFAPLSISALARSRADWLYGMNMTRAYTLHGKKQGYNGVLSVGRVQTPVLGLVVQRDQDIQAFEPKAYFQVQAHIEAQGAMIAAQWQPSEACRPHMDEEGRVLNKALAENVARRITEQPALVDSVKKQNKKQNAPLPYNLSALQIDAAKAFGLNAKQVLEICQTLYEKHKLITYPRSDCRYLPKEHHVQAPKIINHLAQSRLDLAQKMAEAQPGLKSKAFNDAKVSAHHAIVPTEKAMGSVSLTPLELKIYSLIARQYAAQFFPAYQYDSTEIIFVIGGGRFIAKENVPLALGWKVLFGSANSDSKSDNEAEASNPSGGNLPQLKKGEEYWCKQGEVLEKVTQPPSPFTDATLLAAMTGIARFVSSPDIKKILKETDGLGTEATRAGIIDLLFKRGFLQRTGKTIQATDVGRALIAALPIEARSPDMTALWESTLNDISEQKSSYQAFMSPLLSSLENMLSSAHRQDFSNLPQQPFKKKRASSKGAKYSNYKKRPKKQNVSK